MKVFTVEELPELMYLVTKRDHESITDNTFNEMVKIPESTMKHDPLYIRMTKKAVNRWER